MATERLKTSGSGYEMSWLVYALAISAVAGLASACSSSREKPPSNSMLQDLLIQARKLDLSGQQQASIALYRQAIERDPNSYDANYGLARALDLVGSYDEAREHFARAVELAPRGDKDQAMRMLGISWTFAGNLDEASRIFQKVFEGRLSDKNFAAAAEEANELGRLHLELGDLAGAEAWYGRGHEVAGRAADRPQWQIDLADMRLAHAQARIAARRGLAQEARREVAIVHDLLAKGGNDDQKVEYAYLLGYVNFYLGEYHKAVEALAQADQQDPAVLLLLAQATEKLGQADRARDGYRRVGQSSAHSISSALARPIARQSLAAGGGR